MEGERKPEELFGPYFNGSCNVHGDPLKIRRILLAKLDGKPHVWCQRTFDPDPAAQSQALGRLAQAAVEAFGLVPFEPKTGKGITEQQAIDILVMYNKWSDSKKSSTRDCPTGSLPTVSGESPLPTSTSGFTSTSTGSENEGLSSYRTA